MPEKQINSSASREPLFEHIDCSEEMDTNGNHQADPTALDQGFTFQSKTVFSLLRVFFLFVLAKGMGICARQVILVCFLQNVDEQ